MPNPTLTNFLRNPFLVGGLAFALLVSLLGLFSPLIGPHDPLDQQLRLRHQPPLSTGTALDRSQTPPAEEERFYVLGTDHLGRDVLSRLLASFKFNAYIGLLAWGLGTGLVWLLIALKGGPARAAASGPTRSFPLALLNSSSLVMAGIILGVTHLLFWSYLRVVLVRFDDPPVPISTTAFLLFSGIICAFIPASLLYQSLTQAALARGGGPSQGRNRGWLLLRRTLLLAPVGLSLGVLVSLFIDYPWSFLGLGVQPPQSSLGLMLSQGRQYLITAWWVFYIPLMLLVIAIGALLAIALPVSGWQGRALYPVRPESGGQLSTENAPYLERLGALLIDLILLWLLKTAVPIIFSFLVILLIYFVRNAPLINWLLNEGSQILAYMLMAAYFPFFWARSGQTPGMRVFGIKVVRTEAAPVALSRAVLRLVGLAVSVAALFVGVIWALFDTRRQGWHDKIAGTLVVRVAAPDAQHGPGGAGKQ